jgi:hypothetical protein
MKKLYIYPIFLLTFIFHLTSQAQDAGKALQLDGIDDFVSVPFITHNLSNFTLECWVNVPTYDDNVHYISIYQNTFLLIGDYSSGVVSTWADGLSPVDAGSAGAANHPTLGTKEWHHLAFTFDGTTQRILVDGVIVDEQPTTGTVTADDVTYNQGMTIGSRYDGIQQFATGLLDEVRVWSYARSETDIDTYKNQLLVGNEFGLIGYWNFDEGTKDFSQYNQDGILQNGATLVDSDAPVADVTFDHILTGEFVTDNFSNYQSSWGDFDGDGDPDLFVAGNSSGTSKFYENNGDSTFTSIVAGDLGNDTDASFGSSWGDYDNDGFVDLFVANGGFGPENNALYHNNGDGTMTRVVAGDLGADNVASQNGSWADYDNDGFLDLLVANHDSTVPNYLYHNNGDGTFTLDPNFALTDLAQSWSVTWGDYDNDGDQDIYVSNNGAANFMYRNNGGSSFTAITTGEPVTDVFSNLSASWVDYDNDGDLDLFVPGYFTVNKLYQNDGLGNFTAVLAGDLGVGSFAHWSGLWGDYNDDGRLDVLVTVESGNNRLFRNVGNYFIEDHSTSLSQNDRISLGGGWADYDLDGDLDLYVANFIADNDFYDNEGNTYNWLDVTLEGMVSNKSAIGAKIVVRDSWGIKHTQVVNGQSGRGQSPLNQHFGLWGAEVKSVVVYWPSGLAQAVKTGANQFITIQEGLVTDGRPKVLLLAADTEIWVKEVQRKLIESGEFGLVDIIPAGSETPTTADLQNYDAVLAWSDFGFADAALLGDNLAAYADNGGVVVTAVFALSFSPLQGDFATNYQLIIPGGGTTGTNLTLGTINLPDHPLMNNVFSFDGGTSSYHGTSTSLTSGSFVVAEWSDATPLIVGKENIGPANVKRVDINFFPPSTDSRSDFWVAGTSGVKIMTNALLWALAPPDQFTKVIGGGIADDIGAGSWGVSWGDYDNNGDLDLFVGNQSQNDLLYQNNGNGTFTKNVSDPVTINNTSTFTGVWGDYDNDGFEDLFVPNANGNDILYRNNGNGTLSQAIDFGDGAFSSGGAWGDYDADGWLDLFVTTYSGTNFLYQNNQNGTFTLSTDPVINGPDFSSYASAWGDYDDDGLLDIYITSFGGANVLLNNNGDATFTQILTGDIVTGMQSSLGATWGDYDNDGDLDLFVANYSAQNNELYQNNGDGTFTTINNLSVVTDGSYSTSSSWVDYDNDGWLDLFVTTDNNENDMLYRNNTDGTFAQMNLWVPTSDAKGSFGGSWADYDNDGDLDLAVATISSAYPVLLYTNNGTTNNWINIKLEGVLSNKDGIGAKVYVLADNGEEQFQEVATQTSFGSQNSVNAEFGLGTATGIDQILIVWPSGIYQKVYNVGINQFITIVEDVVSPTIDSENFPAFYDMNGGAQLASITASDDQSVGSAEILFKGITQADAAFSLVAASTSDNITFEFDLSAIETISDPLGVVYRFNVYDNSGNVVNSSFGRTHVEFTASSLSVPNLKFGKEVTSYQIVSVPLNLDNGSVSATLADDLGTYDEKQWRVFHYSNGSNSEIQNGNVELGKGYWLIIRNSTTIDIGAGQVPQATQLAPYQLALNSGWNQIGNPYNFTISWAEVLAANGNPSGVDTQLTLYNSGFTNSDRLKRFQGAFVFADNAMMLDIPVLKNTSIQGRVADTSDGQEAPIDEANWKVDLNLRSGDFIYQLGGFGMNESSKLGKDDFDNYGVPRFIEYLDLTFSAPDDPDFDLAREIVPTEETHQWEFTVESSLLEENIALEWDNSYWGDSEKDLFLLDKTTLEVIDMRAVNSYQYPSSAKREFQIFYGVNLAEGLYPDNLKVHLPYPNPFDNKITFNVELPNPDEAYILSIQVYNSMGQLVKTISADHATGGFYSYAWDGANKSGIPVPDGIYAYRVIISGTTQEVISGQIMKH